MMAQATQLGRDKLLGVKKGVKLATGTQLVISLQINGMDIAESYRCDGLGREAANVSFSGRCAGYTVRVTMRGRSVSAAQVC
ncbi:MAG: hypothetical protein R3E95_17955 [Thiolinea sp.]